MKKIIIAISVFLLFGCNLSNTPSDRVEEYLSKYNSLNDEVIIDLDAKIANEDLSEENKEIYKKALLRQYENLEYEIKDESINGDKAEVLVQISVYDLFKTEEESNLYMNEHTDEFYDINKMFDKNAYNFYRLTKMLETNDKVKYDIRFYVNKVNDTWVLVEPDRIMLEKIHGIYDYRND